ncbi:phosphotransferase family protein [Streptomyces sp. enrichment culture]|uniref:phosphotransferase family protein n=1 Tax=Streptomyces sp. enrichment culture TaxID=1795815 RepID=UPI003F5595A7
MLPMVETDEDWDAVVPDEAVMRPGVVDLCARLGLAGAPVVRFAEGSQPVYAVGEDHVLKLFPGAAAADGLAEGRVLSYLQDRLPVPTPRVRAAGAYENGWRYVLMSRLPGQNLGRVWASAPAGDRERLVAEIGEALAVLHALDPAPLADVLGPGDWGAFTDRQRAAAVARQRDRGLPEAWLEQIPDFLASVPVPRVPPRPALLHTEVMRRHFLVEPDGWRLTGLSDFEPAMIGDPAYDFVGVGVFVTGADRSLMGRLTRAYGHRVDPRTAMAYTLLHVYANLPWYLGLNPPRGTTLDALAEEWFGADDD